MQARVKLSVSTYCIYIVNMFTCTFKFVLFMFACMYMLYHIAVGLSCFCLTCKTLVCLYVFEYCVSLRLMYIRIPYGGGILAIVYIICFDMGGEVSPQDVSLIGNQSVRWLNCHKMNKK